MTPEDFPGGSVVENPPANAGDKGLIPCPGRSHNILEELSSRATTTEARAARAHALQREKRPQ